MEYEREFAEIMAESEGRGAAESESENRPYDVLAQGAHTAGNVVSDNPQKRKKGPAAGDDKSKKQQKVQENRAVYVTNIPRDATFEEIDEVFKRYGIIDQGVEGKPRIKMYTDEEGNFNGEALVIFFKKDSVFLAIQQQDDYEFRLGDQSNGTIRVQEADFAYKKNKDSDAVASKLVRKDRKAAERNRLEMNRKLAEWSDNEEEVKEAFAPKKNKWAKVAIIKGAFKLDQIEAEDEAILEIKADMREAAEQYGDVTKVVLYDKEPEGIVTVRFKEFQAAEEFRNKFNNKRYNHTNLEITIAEDRPKFKKSGGHGSDSEDDVTRMERFLKDGEDTDEEN